MKLRGLMLVFMLMIGLNSCMWGEKDKKATAEITKDTLVYTYETIHDRASDCGSKPDTGCTVVKIKYPVFRGQSPLNDSISKKLIKLLILDDLNTTSPDLTSYSQSFLDSYLKAKQKYKDGITFYNLNSYARVLRQDSSLTTLEIDGQALQDGFRWNSSTCFINWNTKTVKNVLLGDIFTGGYEDKLTKIADSIFRKQEKLSPAASLAKDYLFKQGRFSLNDNYLITPLGIKFLYNVYEIKPYSAGQTELFIPYSQIKQLLRPNTVITQYIK